LRMMEKLYRFDLLPTASLVMAACSTGRWGWVLGRRGYWMHFNWMKMT